MKQQKLIGYQPIYPRKPLRTAAMTAAALVAMGGVTGCRLPIPKIPGMVLMPEPTEQTLVLDGEVAIETPEPTEELALQGKVLVTEPPEEELVIEGDVAIPEEPEKTPEAPLQTTGVLLVPTATPEA